jgi:hypothetical protein
MAELVFFLLGCLFLLFVDLLSLVTVFKEKLGGEGAHEL